MSIFFTTLFSQSWVKKNVSIASIEFATNPDFRGTPGVNELHYVKLDTIEYALSVTVLTKMESMPEGDIDLKDLYKGAVDGAVHGDGGFLMKSSEYTIGTLRGIEFEYRVLNNPNVPKFKFGRAILLDGKFFMLIFGVYEMDTQKMEFKDKFFNSFAFSVDTSKLKQGIK